MNQELLEKVRNLKLQGLDEGKIVDQLAPSYPVAEINQCLISLQHMQPVSLGATASDVTPAAAPKQPRNRHKRLISFGVVFILMIFGAIYLWNFTKIQSIQKLDDQLKDKYGVNTSYDLGSLRECGSQGPTKFGEVTSVTVCYLTSARLYYPRTKIYNSGETYYIDGKPVLDTLLRLDYVDRDNKPLNGFVSVGAASAGALQPDIETKLKLPFTDHLVINTVSSNQVEPQLAQIDSKWQWSDNTGWFGSGTKGKAFQKEISEKIVRNESPAKGAPTISTAMSQGTAPLVVYYITRYCHNPDFILLDHMCVLPN